MRRIGKQIIVFWIIVTVFLNNIIIVHASQLDTLGSELNQSDITDTNQNESMSENNDLLPTEDSEFEEHVIEESNSKDLEEEGSGEGQEEEEKLEGEPEERPEEEIPEEVVPEEEAGEIILEGELVTDTIEEDIDNDTLFDQYVSNLLGLDDGSEVEEDVTDAFEIYGDTSYTNNVSNGPRRTPAALTGIKLRIFNYLKGQLARIAQGEITDTKIYVPMSELNISLQQYSAEDLGVSTLSVQDIDGSYHIASGVKDALASHVGVQYGHDEVAEIIRALNLDCPSELYWWNGTCSFKGELPIKAIPDETTGEWVSVGYAPSNSLEFGFQVSVNYRTDLYHTLTTRINRAKTALQNAQNIVATYASQSDYNKLRSYATKICDLVKYDHNYEASSQIDNHDPWRIIEVFTSTAQNPNEVVCEGYAKAYKYLCDLSDFDRDIECNVVFGSPVNVTTGDQYGPHAWNIVDLEGAGNYLVDVTWLDGTSRNYTNYFLAGAINSSGSVENGYVFKSNTGNVRRPYDNLTKQVYTAKQLKMSTKTFTIKENNKRFTKGSTRALHPSNILAEFANWSSSNTNIVSINARGVITAKAVGTATITAVKKSDGTTATCTVQVINQTKTFSDVCSPVAPAQQAAILYLANEGIVNGFNDGTYRPFDTLTRGQAVMILWRAAGEPAPQSSVPKFSDVGTSHIYFNGIQWAAENKIANGFSNGTFLPNADCTRGMLMSFLWRYKGMPKPKTATSPFSDVASSHVYFKQIMWASEQGITQGYSDGTFRPDISCNRAQYAIFIYRMLQL